MTPGRSTKRIAHHIARRVAKRGIGEILRDEAVDAEEMRFRRDYADEDLPGGMSFLLDRSA